MTTSDHQEPGDRPGGHGADLVAQQQRDQGEDRTRHPDQEQHHLDAARRCHGARLLTYGSTTSPPVGSTRRSRPRRTSIGFVRQRIEPPPRWNWETSTSTTSKPHSSSRARTPVRAGRHQHRPADDDRVGGERRQRLLLGDHERLRHQREQRGRGLVVEGGGADDGPAVVERAEGEVQVVHPRVGDPQPADPDTEIGGQHLEAELVGARAVADDQLVAPRERVARLEVGADAVAAGVRRGEPAAGEPGRGRGGLHPALGVPHVRQHDVAGRRR